MNLTMLMKFGEHITVDSPMNEKIIFGLQVVGIGMGVVFGVLILLIGILQLFKLFSVKQPKESPAESAAPVASAPVAASVPASDEEKIVAIATSAIAAYCGKSNVDFRVLSIAPAGQAVNVCSAPAPAPAVEKVSAPAPATAPVAAPAPVVSGEGEKITAPLPGNILDVKVANGAAVKKGDVLCILEAMKMENEIVAPRDGTINAVVATKGSSVNTGDVLFVIG